MSAAMPMCKMPQHQSLLPHSNPASPAAQPGRLPCRSFTLCNNDSTLSSHLRRSSTVAAMSHLSLTDRSRTELSTTTTTTTTTTYNNTTITSTPTSLAIDPPLPSNKPQDDEVGVQELTVYEVNELDRGSPMLLSLSKLAIDWYNRFRMQPLGSLGDLVPFTNKIFDGSLKKRLGITAGLISVMRHYPKEDALLFESVYSFYFGDYGHISVKGPYKTHEDTVLTVTGGSGIFTGVYGTVQIHNVEYPFLLFYKFQLYGILQLPQALRWDTIPPAKGLRPSRTASMPGFALPNFTD